MEKQDHAPTEIKEREVTVYNTVGSCNSTITTKSRTWGELKKDLAKNGIPHSDMKAIIGENQEELENEDQNLSETAFTLFLTPIKVRSGLIIN